MKEPGGSNGIAVSPKNTIGHHALLLINPHTSFYFRSEFQVTSDEGLNAYGAATWGQMFIYQGFNEHCGWMHTSSAVDQIDEYLETVVEERRQVFLQVRQRRASGDNVERSKFRTPRPAGMAEKTFTVYRTQHGPIIRAQDGKWVSVAHDVRASEGADAIIQTHKGEELCRVQAGHGTAHQLVEQHDLSPMPTATSLTFTATSFRAAIRNSTGPNRSMAAIRRLIGMDCSRLTNRRKLFNPASGWLYNTQQLAVVGRRTKQSETMPIIRNMSTTASSLRAACTRFGCWKQEGFHARDAARCGLRQLPDVV